MRKMKQNELFGPCGRAWRIDPTTWLLNRPESKQAKWHVLTSCRHAESHRISVFSIDTERCPNPEHTQPEKLVLATPAELSEELFGLSDARIEAVGNAAVRAFLSGTLMAQPEYQRYWTSWLRMASKINKRFFGRPKLGCPKNSQLVLPPFPKRTCSRPFGKPGLAYMTLNR